MTSPAKSPKTAAANGPTVMTLKSLFEQVGAAHALPKKQLTLMATELVSTMTAQLAQSNRIPLAGLGTLEVRQRPARTARNPATGAPMQIAASKKVAFRLAKELKNAI